MVGVQLPQGYRATARRQFTFYKLEVNDLEVLIESFKEENANLMIVKSKLDPKSTKKHENMKVEANHYNLTQKVEH